MSLKNIAIIGYGSQAKTWSLNLKESGLDVLVILRDGSSSIQKAQSDGFRAVSYEEIKSNSSVIDDISHFALLIPDGEHTAALEKIAPLVKEGSSIILAHGYSVCAANIQKQFNQLNFLMLAPKAIASGMRKCFLEKKHFPGAYSLEHSKNKELDQVTLLFLAEKLGMSTPVEVSFKEETICDLFSEQSLLCSIIPYGIRYAYETLREKNINPEMALSECLFETKLIIESIEKMGFDRFFKVVSPNALIGGQKAVKDTRFQELRNLFTSLINDISQNKFYEEVEKTNRQKLREEVSEDWTETEVSQTWEKVFGQK